MAKKKKTIRVRIRARQMVRYDEIVEMTPTEWNNFKKMTPRQHTQCGGDLVGGWIDANNIDGADDINPDDFEAEVVDESGKPTGERYEG